MNFTEAQAQIAEIGRQLHAAGWVPATSGNFSVRLDDGEIAITTSGRHKGRLSADDLMRIDLSGAAQSAGKPSAETALHTQLYRRDPSIGAVLHTHSVGAALASASPDRNVRFQNLEILKAFDGIDTHEAAVDIPVFANDQNIPALAQVVETAMTAERQGIAYLIEGHGLYTWSRDLDGCIRHLEALEYLFEYRRLSA